VQTAVLSYPSRAEIDDSVETFYKQFSFLAGKIAEMSAEMPRSPQVMKRRLREGSSSSPSCGTEMGKAPTPD
jgi:hypothetical protein